MKALSQDVVQIVKQIPFFQNFDEESIVNFANNCEVQKFNVGQKILDEGKVNKNLYFLTAGKISVALAGEVVAVLDRFGDVFGEMSAVTGEKTTTTVMAAEAVECLVLSIDKFIGKNQQNYKLQVDLYQIFCRILSRRLAYTNEKARLFEILNREMHEAQSKISQSGARVLLIEPDKKQQQPIKLALGGTGVSLEIADTHDGALEKIRSEKYDLILAEEEALHVIENHPDTPCLLLTKRDVRGSVGILERSRAVNFVISRNPDDRQGTIRSILTSMSKILNTDYFGIEKYLSWGADIKRIKVTHSTQREDLKQEIHTYFKKMGIRGTILDRVHAVVEEMLMNAIYDAPVDAQGQSLFNHMSRKEVIELDTHQQASLNFACDGSNIAVAVVDPFGALTKDIIIDYLVSCYGGNAGALNENKGGAGRGLHQIVEQADTTIFNVKKGVRTEVICLFNIDGLSKDIQPSIHYYFN